MHQPASFVHKEGVGSGDSEMIHRLEVPDHGMRLHAVQAVPARAHIAYAGAHGDGRVWSRC